MSDTVIRVEHLSKEYRLGVINHGRLTKDIQSWWAKIKGKDDPNRKIGHAQARTRDLKSDRFWALKDMTFDVRSGERLGIIGSNGAGKSTFLKILSRVTAPTIGTIKLKGRVASLLEVGTGFNPELTGRENVYLNGAILGMRKAEVQSKFDDIVSFAEVERFIDTPVKRYSSGMYVRLAFAVAAHLDADIMVIDEVLAVGDARFQQKCLGKMEEASTKEGRTVLFVSHNMTAVKNLCSRAILFEGGRLTADGETSRVVHDYLANQQGVLSGSVAHDDDVGIEKVVLRNSRGEQTSEFAPGSDLSIELTYVAKYKINRPSFWVTVGSTEGSHFAANMLIDGHTPSVIEGRGSIRCVFHNLPLLPKTYIISLGVRSTEGSIVLAKSQTVGTFTVFDDMRRLGLEGGSAASFAESSAPIVVPYDWYLPTGEHIQVSYPALQKQS